MISHPPVGAAGFEPATSWSQTRRDDRTTLRPEHKTNAFNDAIRYGTNPAASHPSQPSLRCGGSGITSGGLRFATARTPRLLIPLNLHFVAVGAGFEPAVRLPVRQFSKLLVSATHPSHLVQSDGKNRKSIW